MEAKGHSGRLDTGAMIKAKAQTRRLRNINGALSNIRVAVQAYFAPELSFAIEDPDGFDEETVDLLLNEDQAIRQYYSYLLKADHDSIQKATIDNREFDSFDLGETGITVGLSSGIREMLNADTLIDFKTLRSLSESGTDRDGDGVQVFSDGIVIELDERWSEDAMSIDPVNRVDQ